MSEPKAGLEAGLLGLLNDDGWAVYNTRGAGATIEYIVFSAAGGDDEGYHLKDRGRIYEYQIVGIALSRDTALSMNADIDDAMAGARSGLSITGHSVIQVARVGAVDYAQDLPDGRTVYYVGGIYLIELEED